MAPEEPASCCAKFLSQLRRLLGMASELDRKLILQMAKKIAIRHITSRLDRRQMSRNLVDKFHGIRESLFAVIFTSLPNLR